MVIEAHSFSFIGARQNNEDALYPQQNQSSQNERVFVVCDGMGGYSHGGLVSAKVCVALSDLSSFHTTIDQKIVVSTLRDLQKELQLNFDSIASPYSGTTIAMVVFNNNNALIANLGDSRVYQIRTNSEKKIIYKSKDHSLVQDLFDKGEISEDQLMTHPKRNIITKAFMPFQDTFIFPDFYKLEDIQAGDYFFICSDGVWENLNDKDLLNLLHENISNTMKTKKIAEHCRFSKDNYTACLIQIVEYP